MVWKMKKDFLSAISFEEANNSLKIKDIHQVMKNDKKQNFSVELKKTIILILGLVFPVLMAISFAVDLNDQSLIISSSIVIVAELLISILMCYHFFRADPPSV